MGFGFNSYSNATYDMETDVWTGGMKDYSTTQLVLPSFTFAVESGLTDWATARVGLNKSFYLMNSNTTPAVAAVAGSCSDETSVDETACGTASGTWTAGTPASKEVTTSNMSGSPLNYSFGLGFNYGSFQLDVDVTEDLYTNPWQKIVGFDSLGSTTATLTYTW